MKIVETIKTVKSPVIASKTEGGGGKNKFPRVFCITDILQLLQSLPVKPKQPHCESPKGTSLSHWNDGKQHSRHCKPAGCGNPVNKSPHHNEQTSRHNARDKGFQYTQNSNELTKSSTCCSARNNMQKAAFTLAEVLITLGIIGVVAAMTLPSVINKTEKIILKNQFKKAYSVYSQALLRTAVDYDGIPNCYYKEDANGLPSTINMDKSGCLEFFDKFAKNMKIIKKCEGNSFTEKCVPKYSEYTTVAGCEGFSESAFNQTNTVYVIADGTIMMPYGSENSIMPLFAFDINGKKGPNIPGQDLFSINILQTTSGMMQLYTKLITGCLPQPADELKYEDMFK